MDTKQKNNEFIYNMLFNANPPSVFRLAIIQLRREGIKFNSEETIIKNWNLMIDRAVQIRDALTYKHQNKKIKRLHRDIVNARTF